jgi:APA family basic amino acid/polyamine antiporter
LALLAIVAAAFFVRHPHETPAPSPAPTLSGISLLGALVAALSGAFWAYDGWGNIAYIAGEVRTPEKTIPRAIVLGTFCFVGLYVLINLAYLHVLPISAIGAAPGDRVASMVMTAAVGSKGAVLIAALIMLSTFDTTNSSTLTNARVYYAMAKDGIFAQGADRVHTRFHTPYKALAYQGAWAAFLLLTGSFDLVASMYVFVNWSLYLLLGLGVFVLRRRSPDAPRPFRTPGYPVVPFVFVAFSALFVIFTLANDVSDFNSGKQPIIKSLMGVLLVTSGLPLYYYWKKRPTMVTVQNL